MSTESIVHLRSSTSMSNLSGVSQPSKKFKHKSKSPMNEPQTARNHASNKEN